MIHLPSDPMQRLWLAGLLVLWATLLFGGFILGPTRSSRRIPVWARMISSFTLVVAAWSWVKFAQGTENASYAVLVAIGVTCGFIGDMFLANVITRKPFLSTGGGIASFAVGHLFYISGIALLIKRIQHNQPCHLWGALTVFWLIALIGWRFMVLGKETTPSRLQWGALLYSLLLASTAGAASGLALHQPEFYPLAFGAVLFLISDVILAIALFNDTEFPLHHDIVWLTYGPGQMLIVYSVGAAMLL